MNSSLKPCPFCGSKYVAVRSTHRRDGISNTQYEVYCMNCSAVGGSRINETDARDDWNNRVYPKQLIELPAMPGDTLYEIRKVCDTNDGRKEEYKPNIEYNEPCKYFEPASWYNEPDECKIRYDSGKYDMDDIDYPDLNLNIVCNECKNRFCIQKTKFEWGDIDKVVGTAMYNEDTEPWYRKYLTEEDAKKALEEILKENNK